MRIKPLVLWTCVISVPAASFGCSPLPIQSEPSTEAPVGPSAGVDGGAEGHDAATTELSVDGGAEAAPVPSDTSLLISVILEMTGTSVRADAAEQAKREGATTVAGTTTGKHAVNEVDGEV